MLNQPNNPAATHPRNRKQHGHAEQNLLLGNLFSGLFNNIVASYAI
jgi:hypothetical protein